MLLAPGMDQWTLLFSHKPVFFCTMGRHLYYNPGQRPQWCSQRTRILSKKLLQRVSPAPSFALWFWWQLWSLLWLLVSTTYISVWPIILSFHYQFAIAMQWGECNYGYGNWYIHTVYAWNECDRCIKLRWRRNQNVSLFGAYLHSCPWWWILQ